MPNVTFTIDDTIAGVGPKKLSFYPRNAYATPAGAIVPAVGPKPIKDKSFARGVVHTVALPEGPWWVAGLADEYLPIDVGPSGGDLKDLIAWEVPQNAPTTTLAAGIAAWAQAHGVDIIAEEAGLLTQEAADAAYAPKWLPSTAYTAGALVMLPAPINGPGTRNTNGTSRASFDATEQGLWTPAAVPNSVNTRNKVIGWFNVADFGAKGDGVTDDTAAIQAAIDAAAATRSRGKVILPAGDFRVTRLIWKKGVYLVGAGIGGFGTPNTQWGTVIRQLPSQNTDVICYDDPQASNGRTYAGPAGLVDLEVVGSNTSTTGYCLNFTTPDGRTCCVQDTLTIHNVLFRGGAQGGVLFPAGGFPLHVSHVNCLWNGGPGITYIRGPQGASQAIHFDNISGDGNIGGLIYIDNDNNANAGEFLITNLKSEMRFNTAYGNQAGQINAIRLHRCPAPVTIINANHYSSVEEGPYAGVAPGALVVATGAVPNVDWSGIVIDTNNRTGTPVLIDDQQSAQAVPFMPAGGRRGSYGLNPEVSHLAATSERGRWKYGQPGSNWPDTVSHGEQVSGITPGFAFWETDAADANEKLWAILASGGNLSIRTFADTGAAGSMIVELQRNGTTVGAMRVTAPIVPYSSNTAQRRTASQAPGGMAYDTTLGKPIWSDGSVWRDANGNVV